MSLHFAPTEINKFKETFVQSTEIEFEVWNAREKNQRRTVKWWRIHCSQNGSSVAISSYNYISVSFENS